MIKREGRLLKELEVTRKSLNRKAESNVLNDLGELYRTNGRYERALQYYKEGADVADAIEDWSNAPLNHRAIAEINVELNYIDAALRAVEEFRDCAKRSKRADQIQLSFHVTGWVYQRLWVANSDDRKRSKYLIEGIKWAKTSLDFISKNCDLINKDKEAVKQGGNCSERTAGLHRLIASMTCNCGGLSRRKEAEYHLNAALKYADSVNDTKLRWECYHAKVDFPWVDKEMAVRKLTEIAKTPKDMSEALFLLAETLLTVKEDYTAAKDTYFKFYLHYMKTKKTKLLTNQDNIAVKENMIFLYKLLKRMKVAELSSDITEKKKLCEKIADSLFEKKCFAGALKYYKEFNKCCSTDEERVIALVSIFQTYSEINDFKSALVYAEMVEDLETKMDVSLSKKKDTQISIFKIRTEGKMLSKEDALREYEELKERLTTKQHIELLFHLCAFLRENYPDEDLDRKKYEDLLKEEERLDSGSSDAVMENASSTEPDEFDEMPMDLLWNEVQKEAETWDFNAQLLKEVNRKVTRYGETRLHLAAMEGKLDMLKKLIKMKYSVNARDYGNWTPLSEAVCENNLDCARCLLQNGADINCYSTQPIGHGRCETTVDNETGTHMTPLMEACNLGNLKMITMLMRFKPDVTMRNSLGLTAVDFLKLSLKTEKGWKPGSPHFNTATILIGEMEKLQKQAGFPVRTGPIPIRSIPQTETPSRIIFDRQRNKENEDTDADAEPSSSGVNMYRKAISKFSKGRLDHSFNTSSVTEDVTMSEDCDGATKFRVPIVTDDMDMDFACIGIPSQTSGDGVNGRRRSSGGLPSVCTNTLSDFAGRSSPTSSFGSFSNGSRRRSNDGPASSTQYSDMEGGIGIRTFIENDRDRKRKRLGMPSDERGKRSMNERSVDRSFGEAPVVDLRFSSPHVSPESSPEANINRSRTSRLSSPTRLPSLNSNRGGRSQVPRNSQTPPNNEPKIQTVPIKVHFQNTDGTQMRNPKIVQMQVTGMVSDLSTKCSIELEGRVHRWTLLDKTEIEGDMDYNTLKSFQPASIVELVCQLQMMSIIEEYKRMSACPLDDVLHALDSFTLSGSLNLSSVPLRKRQLDDVFKALIKMAPNKITQLEMSGISLKVPHLLRDLSPCLASLTLLDLSSCDLDESSVNSLKVTPMISLRTLRISHNSFSSGRVLSDFLEKCTAMVSLTMNNVEINRDHDQLINSISSLENIEDLDLSNNRWLNSSHSETILSACLNLINCNLGNTLISEMNIETQWAVNLRSLSLGGCSLLDQFDSLTEWISMSGIERIDLSACRVTLPQIEKLMLTRRGRGSPLIVTLIGCKLPSGTDIARHLLKTSSNELRTRFIFDAPIMQEIRNYTVYCEQILA